MSDDNYSVPHRSETERALLAHVLTSDRGVEQWRRWADLCPYPVVELFFVSEYRTFAATIEEFLERTRALSGRIPIPMLADAMADRTGADPQECVQKVATLASAATLYDEASVMTAVATLMRMAALRTQIDVCEQAIDRIAADEPDPETSLRRIEDELAPTRTVYLDEGTLFGATMDRLDRDPVSSQQRMPTGLAELDAHLLGGVESGRLLVVAGRPKMGKTTFMLNMALNALAEGYHVFFVSMEIGPRELRDKLVSAQSLVPFVKVSAWFDHGEDVDEELVLTDDELEQVEQATTEIHDSNLHVLFHDDVPHGVQSITSALMSWRAAERATRMRAKAEAPAAEKASFDIPAKAAVFVDYLQLLDEQGRPTAESLSADARTLKREALRQDVAMVVASQLNRNAADGSLSTTTLKGSGGIEEHCDTAVLLTRPHAVEMDLHGESTHAESDMVVSVGLNRVYRTGTFHAVWLPEVQSVVSVQDVGQMAATTYDETADAERIRERVQPEQTDAKTVAAQSRSRRRRHVDDMDL